MSEFSLTVSEPAESEDALLVSGTDSALSGVASDSATEFTSLVEADSGELLSSAKVGGAKQERQIINAISNAVKRCLILYFCFIVTSNKHASANTDALEI